MSERAYGKENQFNSRFPVRKRKVSLYCYIVFVYSLLVMANCSNLSSNLGTTRLTQNGSKRVGE